MRRISSRSAVSSRPLVQSKAHATDLDFICGCILYGARKGHYAFNPENSLHIRCMKNEIHSIIARGLLLDRRHASASIYTLNGKRIAMLITSEAEPGSGCVEIYALSVVKKYQNQGYGSLILDDLINHSPHADIYARCSSASESMYRLLSDRYFTFLGTDGEHRVLRRDGVPNRDNIPTAGSRAGLTFHVNRKRCMGAGGIIRTGNVVRSLICDGM